jgi:hypothetical protein
MEKRARVKKGRKNEKGKEKEKENPKNRPQIVEESVTVEIRHPSRLLVFCAVQSGVHSTLLRAESPGRSDPGRSDLPSTRSQK